MKHLLILGKCVIIMSCFMHAQSVKLSSLDLCYKKGVEAYSGERWSECISQFEEAIHLYKLYKSININCRLKCNNDQITSVAHNDFEDLKYYERLFLKRNCFSKCQSEDFADMNIESDIQESVLNNMQKKKPYEYLHICYFQMYFLPKAASAAYTYYVANPKDETIKHNLQYYAEQSEVDVNEIADLESEIFSDLFKIALKTYKQNNWFDTVSNMEEVIRDYLSWEDRCRAECEQQPQQDSSSEFVLTLSNNVVSLLHCEQQCQSVLLSLGSKSGVEFLADVLNYLQISYYHLNKYNDAAKAVTSYLLLLPNDEQMIENKNIYSFLTENDAFTKRSDIAYYLQRDMYEKKLLTLYFNENDIDNNLI